MAVTSTTVVTYESRQIISDDSARASALFEVTTTTTTRTAPDTPEGTTVSESVQFLSIDYTPIYTIIASNVETISNNIETIKQAATLTSTSLDGIYTRTTGAGLHMKGPQDWIGLISTYKLYLENEGPEKMTLVEFIDYFNKIKDLPKDF